LLMADVWVPIRKSVPWTDVIGPSEGQAERPVRDRVTRLAWVLSRPDRGLEPRAVTGSIGRTGGDAPVTQ